MQKRQFEGAEDVLSDTKLNYSPGPDEACLNSDALIASVYDKLRSLARNWFVKQPSGHTLQPTAIVHEAFLRLAERKDLHQLDRAHFIALASRVMRQVLIDHARAKQATKRGGKWSRIRFDESVSAYPDCQIEVIALDEALTKLSKNDERQAKVAELRFIGGLTVEEVASVIGVSSRTVELEWRMARAWLQRELGEG